MTLFKHYRLFAKLNEVTWMTSLVCIAKCIYVPIIDVLIYLHNANFMCKMHLVLKDLQTEMMKMLVLLPKKVYQSKVII